MKKEHKKFFKAYGEKLRQLRKESGLSQQGAAGKCGNDRSKIGKMENGEINYLVSTLLELADALDAEVEVMFRRKSDGTIL